MSLEHDSFMVVQWIMGSVPHQVSAICSDQLHHLSSELWATIPSKFSSFKKPFLRSHLICIKKKLALWSLQNIYCFWVLRSFPEATTHFFVEEKPLVVLSGSGHSLTFSLLIKRGQDIHSPRDGRAGHPSNRDLQLVLFFPV